MKKTVFTIVPIGKPRMVRSDKWSDRKAVSMYFMFKDMLNLQANLKKFSLPDDFKVCFYLPMPQSWSDKKKKEMVGKFHQQKPDHDNLEKALTDALRKEDSTIYHADVWKFWDFTGRIEVFT